jgi:hypothetical protein
MKDVFSGVTGYMSSRFKGDDDLKRKRRMS